VIGNSHNGDSSLDSRSWLSIINYGETLYGWGEYPDYVWKGFGDKETHPKYKGGVENGVPNGLGYLIYPSGGKYVGSWKDGKKNGQGTFTWKGGWKDGDYYEGVFGKIVGEWKDGIIWNGTEYDKDGNIEYKIVNVK
jgi:hypothetical protein